MIWAVVGATLGAASTDAGSGAENAVTIFGAVMLVYAWSMYFYLKREQTKRRQTSRQQP